MVERLLKQSAVRRAFAEEAARQGAECTQLSPRLLAWLEGRLHAQIRAIVTSNRDHKRATVTTNEDDE